MGALLSWQVLGFGAYFVPPVGDAGAFAYVFIACVAAPVIALAKLWAMTTTCD